MSRRKQSNPKPLKRDDEDWSDSEKTPSVGSGLDGGGSAVSSPLAPAADEDPGLPPPPRLNILPVGEDVRQRLAGLPEDARKRLASLTDDLENSRDQPLSLKTEPQDGSPKSSRTEIEEDCGLKDEEASGRASVSSSSGSSGKAYKRRDSGDSRRSEEREALTPNKRSRFDDQDAIGAAAAAPRLRLNTSLATDPALRPQAVAALTLKHDGPSPPLAAGLQNALNSNRLYVLPSDLKKDAIIPDCPPLPGRPIGLICPPCGIRFSSASTLEAHRTFYCAHRPRPETEGGDNGDDDDEHGGISGKTGKSFEHQQPKKAYACPHCSYSADKKVSLNRHMRMHASSPMTPLPAAQAPVVMVNSSQASQVLSSPVAQANNGNSSSSVAAAANGSLNEEAERYCRNCDIRFSSLKNYRAHKIHYCSTRHVVKDTPPPPPLSSSASSLKASPPTSSSPGDSPPPNASTPGAGHPQPCLALPTNPILIVPYSLFRGASVLSAPSLPAPDTPCFLMPNGSLQPMTRGLTSITNTPPTIVNNAKATENVLRAINKPHQQLLHQQQQQQQQQQSLEMRRDQIRDPAVGSACPVSPSPSAPLDLTIRKSPSRQDEKENRVSPLLLPVVGSPRSRGSSSPRTKSLPAATATTPLSNATPTELAMRLAELPPPPVPGVLVKQGVSRCKECNIVFCRHENFIAHKKHYCQARENSSSSPPPSETPSPPLVQLICAACGIKFASMDNLVAHQAFYCPKRPESQDQLTRCTKCKSVIEPGTTHTCPVGQTGGWRCPVCGAISPTAGAAQRHMDAHQGVKAFRCTICRYKGNTLRGMRTHIRMHFEKRGADLQEETYITCVLDDDTTVPNPEPAAATTPEEVIPTEAVNQINGKSDVRKPSPVPPPAARTPTPSTTPSPASKVKQEREESPPFVIVEENSNNSTDSGKTGACYCQSCDIRFSYRSTFIAHKKYYCSSHVGEASNNNNNNSTSNPTSTTPTPTTSPPSARSEASVL